MRCTLAEDQYSKRTRIMLIGFDAKTIVQRNLRTAGYEVLAVNDSKQAFAWARREFFEAAVLLATDCWVDIAATIFELRDATPEMPVIVVVDDRVRPTNRFLRRLIEHPVYGTEILTRGQLRKRLRGAGPLAPPGRPV
jgi:DNA-binding response OmpR family regulator